MEGKTKPRNARKDRDRSSHLLFQRKKGRSLLRIDNMRFEILKSDSRRGRGGGGGGSSVACCPYLTRDHRENGTYPGGLRNEGAKRPERRARTKPPMTPEMERIGRKPLCSNMNSGQATWQACLTPVIRAAFAPAHVR